MTRISNPTGMHSRPKSSAEILATAKRASQKEIQPRKPKTNRSRPLKDHLSTLNFSRNSISDIPSAGSSSSRPANIHGLNNIQFKDLKTPQTLEAALEITEGRDVMVDSEEIPDLVGDELPTTWTSASELESPTDSVLSSQSRMSRSERVQDTLAILRGHRLSPFDLVLEILDKEKPEYSCHRTELYKEGNEKLTKILNAILSSGPGRSKLRNWIRRPVTVDLFCDVITQEMNNVQKAELLPGIAAITPEFIKNWTVFPHQELAPCLLRVLSTAAQTTTAKEKNKIKEPDMLCNILLKQLSYQRSSNSLGFATIFGLFLWATGCARQTIDALHKCGLSICYSSVLNAISSLANQCVELAVNVGSGIHIFCYDNVNLSTSIFVEQRGTSSPAKVTSGTFAVLYKVRNGNPEHMKLAPIIERFKSVNGLKFNLDLQPTVVQLESFLVQLKVIVTRILVKYVKGFEPYSKDQALQHKPRRPIPKGYITEQFPLRATIIEEATVRGNLLFHDDIYITQLKRSTDELSEYAIPSINDQLTNARIRSGQTLRARDVNTWERREVFQLGFGLFHLCLNLVWALLHVHRGSLAEPGSLTYFFALLEKTRLGCEHPDYHTLLAALTQILDGLILNAWQMECNCKTLSDFAATRPSAEDLLNMAGTIIQRYAMPMPVTVQKGDKTTAEDSESGDSDTPQLMARTRRKPAVPPVVTIDAVPDPNQDRAHQNIRLLTRDLLVLAELIRAISDGDIGRVEDFLPQLAMMFRGAGSNNYCTEILHFILNLKYVWTPEFADIMRDNMLVNISGLEGHSMAIDINMEHLIGQLKELLTAKGLESTWDRLGDISAAIDYLNKIKKKVPSALSSSYQRCTHTTPDTSHLVWRVADKLRDEELQVFREKRVGNSKVKAVVDILATGEAKLKSSSLTSFNKKISAMVKGHVYDDEQDAIPQTQLSIGGSDETGDITYYN